MDFETIGSFDKRFHDHRQYREVYPVVYGTLTDEGIRIQYVTELEDLDELLETIEKELETLPKPFWHSIKILKRGSFIIISVKLLSFGN